MTSSSAWAGSRLAANNAADTARDLTHGFMTWLPLMASQPRTRHARPKARSASSRWKCRASTSFPVATKTWKAGTSPAMTEKRKLRRHPVHRADLVAVEIAQISEVHFPRRAFANAGRVFAGLAAIGDA